MSADFKTQYKNFFSEVKRRAAATKTSRRIRFGLVAFLYLLWCLWVGNPWLLLGLVLLFDIYITCFIPFTWWKKSKNGAVRTVMGWVDAIVYALILVYFIFNFLGQNYQIPSSSLEKTLLTGDYLFVNKTTYGPRVPNTPIHFPLVHNKLPILDINSYTSWPENDYHRLAGLRNVELGDIVVFNFPAGDTVATKFEESADGWYYDALVKTYGWNEVNTNKAKFGDVIYRPVDRRTNFVKRAVGMPGQRIKIVDGVIHLDGIPYSQPAIISPNSVSLPRTCAAAFSPATSHTMPWPRCSLNPSAVRSMSCSSRPRRASVLPTTVCSSRQYPCPTLPAHSKTFSSPPV